MFLNIENMVVCYSKMIYVQWNILVMDINRVSFGDMKANFSNLKSIAFINEGIYGPVTPKTFEGIENIETVHIKDTNIESIEDDSFRKLENIQGNT